MYISWTVPFFKENEDLPNNCHFIRQGKKCGHLTIVEIRAIKYVSGDVSYKIRHTKEWKQLPQQRSKRNKVESKQLYQEPFKTGIFRH